MPDMKDWGYTGALAGTNAQQEELMIARVLSAHREQFEVVCEKGFLKTRAKTGEYFRLEESTEFPAVGDFVLIKYNPLGDSLIMRTLPRKSVFSRSDLGGRKAGHGRVSVEQVIAANFDYVCIVMSLNQNYNARRLERYAALAWASGAKPLVVLTKADLTEERAHYLSDAMRIAPGAEVFALSAMTGEGMEEFRSFFKQGETLVFLGSSGVGKSSLVNALMGEEALKVGAVREDDARGRHTTTHRELLMLPSGAMVIDTPGMRELGILGADEGLSTAFSDVEELARRCRFSDCTHRAEPGCAVQAALKAGKLDRARYESFRALERENGAALRRAKEVKLREKSGTKQQSRPRDKSYKHATGD